MMAKNRSLLYLSAKWEYLSRWIEKCISFYGWLGKQETQWGLFFFWPLSYTKMELFFTIFYSNYLFVKFQVFFSTILYYNFTSLVDANVFCDWRILALGLMSKREFKDAY